MRLRAPTSGLIGQEQPRGVDDALPVALPTLNAMTARMFSAMAAA
jgi:hypothetical protein